MNNISRLPSRDVKSGRKIETSDDIAVVYGLGFRGIPDDIRMVQGIFKDIDEVAKKWNVPENLREIFNATHINLLLTS